SWRRRRAGGRAPSRCERTARKWQSGSLLTSSNDSVSPKQWRTEKGARRRASSLRWGVPRRVSGKTPHRRRNRTGGFRLGVDLRIGWAAKHGGGFERRAQRRARSMWRIFPPARGRRERAENPRRRRQRDHPKNV